MAEVEPFFADGQGEGDIVKTFNFDTVSQELLCKKAIEELKKIREPEVNYEIDVLELPKGTKIGDTVNMWMNPVKFIFRQGY